MLHPPDHTIQRFYSLDGLRGFAALGVVVWHYQHFKSHPFQQSLLFFHNHGHLLVYLFFSLSGFIFFWKYWQTVSDRLISLKKFFFLRATRLYPIHLATLLFVGAAQLFLSRYHNEQFIYSQNDFVHFILNLFLASGVGWFGFSFNMPIWSVSIDFFLYLIFFGCAFLLGKRRFLATLIMIFVGWQLITHNFQTHVIHPFVGRGLLSFFVGGIAFQAFHILKSKNHKVRISGMWIIGAVTILFWVYLFWFTYRYPEDHQTDWYFRSALIGFPATILFLALFEAEKFFHTIFKKLSYFGDISYSVYLLQFPVQLFLYCISKYIPINFAQEGIFLLYFTILILTSHASYKWLEIPAQQYLRSHFVSANIRKRK